MKPVVSIIIPVYNGEDSISISLNSLLEQTYLNFEVVIIDDGSEDSTRGIIEKYTSIDSRFKYYFQPNAGVSMARNKGLELAKGDYICFLDSDDFYEKTYIEKMLYNIQKMSADICYCGYNIVSPKGKESKLTNYKDKGLLVDYILGKVSICTTGWLINKRIIDKFNIRFQEEISWGEDFEFFCELLATTEKVCFVDEYLTNYRVDHGDDQLSSFSLDKINKDFESIMRVVNNSKVNKNKTIEKALIDYRLQALIIYRLGVAIDKGINKTEVRYYYKRYIKYIKKTTFNNGLRSIKLNINRIKLKFLINK